MYMCRYLKMYLCSNILIVHIYFTDPCSVYSGVSRVWQVGHVPWVPLEGGATERF